MSFFLAKFSRSISSLLSFFLLYFFVNKDSLGYYSYWYSFILFFGVFVKLNNQVFALRYKEKFKTLYFSYFVIQASITVIISLITLFFLPIKIWGISLLLFFILLFEVWESYFYVINEHSVVNKLITIISFLIILLKILSLYFLRDNLLNFLLLIFPLDFSFGLFLYIFNRKNIKILLKTNSFLIKHVLLFITPFLINSLLIYLTGKIDHYLIVHYLSMEDLGDYSLAYKLYEGLFILQGVFGIMIVSKYNSNMTSLSLRENRFAPFLRKWIFPFLVIPLLLLLSYYFGVLSYFSTNFSFDEYYKLLIVFLVLVSGIVFTFFGVMMSKISAVHDFSKEILIINAITLLINVLLNLVLLPVYGVLGSAIVTVICQIFGSILLWLIFKRTRVIMINMLVSIIKC